MVRYCFDTSAINRLFDDPDREAIVAGLMAGGSIRLTALNVIEAAKTADASRRTNLVSLIRRLTKGTSPIDRPNTILVSICRAHITRAPRIKLNSDPDLEGLWVGLYEPLLIDDAARAELEQFTSQWDAAFDDIAYRARAEMQAARARHPGHVTLAWTLRNFFSNEPLLQEIIGAIYEKATDKALAPPEYEVLTKAQPGILLYLAAHVYALYQRSVKPENYSRKNATGIDMLQAVYLSLCDRYVTSDRRQYAGLRVLNKFNPKDRRPSVMLYDNFRRRLLAL